MHTRQQCPALTTLRVQAQTVPLRSPGSANASPLPRFEALEVLGADWPCDSVPGTSTSAMPPTPRCRVLDAVAAAGGPVWALAWCPLPPHDQVPHQGAKAVETLAVAAHPAVQRRNALGMRVSGPGAVQLWGVPASSAATLLPGGLPVPLALLWHEGRVTWDVAWCPDAAGFVHVSPASATLGDATTCGGVPLQGLLAAVLGSGDVVVWAAPTVGCLLSLVTGTAQQAAHSDPACAAQAEEPRSSAQQALRQPISLRLPPFMTLAASATGGAPATRCAWHPRAPHDQLLVGACDGGVAIWALPTNSEGTPQAVQLLRAGHAPITAIAWQPDMRWWRTGLEPVCSIMQRPADASAATGAPGSPRHVLSGSSVGELCVWDPRDAIAPAHERVISRDTITAAAWLGPPHVAVTASADGTLRQTWLDAGAQAAAGGVQFSMDGARPLMQAASVACC